ncbi:hypothetical protein A4U49_05990 [Acidithiobacillus ferrivorans]|uniref:hypothetical protein n=1 Tax=Acidithiobacillus ferrivorans TaxID=160808 RepID=UPI000893B95C|nr:hypothetical protein [Acidithiobacillus ferrivorans]OFA16728.1 hypothetical protein A4U49_05990 [Acidithiobacillus ferrivorans]
MFNRCEKPLNAILHVVNHLEGGVDKRIDENRELLELLNGKHPEVLTENPWIVGWLASQDRFLVALRNKDHRSPFFIRRWVRTFFPCTRMSNLVEKKPSGVVIWR